MIIYRRYHTASHLGVLLGMMTFCVADASPGLALLATVMIAGSWALFRDTVVSPLPRWAINLLLLGATANLFRQCVVAASLKDVAIILLGEYLIYLQLIKLFESRTPRDQAQLLVLNVMLVIGAVLTSVTLSVGVMLMVYAPVFLYAVLLYQLYAGQHRALAPRRKPAPVVVSLAANAGRWIGWQLRLATALAMVVIVAGSTVVFLVMPRNLGDEFIGRVPEPVAGASSGFSDSVQLGVSGLISESRDIVLEFDLYLDGRRANTPVNQYLRGTVLDRYDPDSHTWDRSLALTEGDALQRNKLRSGRRGATRLPNTLYANSSIEQVYRVINKRTDHLFALWWPGQVACEKREAIFLNPADGTLRMRKHGLLTYAVRSFPYYPNIRAVEAPDGVPDPATGEAPPMRTGLIDPGDDLDPPSGPDPESDPGPDPGTDFATTPADGVFSGTAVERYARMLMAEAGVERRADAATDGQILGLFERHLRANFTYTLDLVPPPEDIDPLQNFLYETKTGHCEYFASAMAAMAQSVGIDARIVTGFVTNELDPATGSYIVRKSHAHAWVEGRVLIVDDVTEHADDVRYTPAWRAFDPTPPSELSAQNRRTDGVVAWVQRLFERAEQMWVRGIVAYSSDQQKSVLRTTGVSTLRFERLAALVSGLRTASVGALLQFLTVAAVSMVALLALLWLAALGTRWLWGLASRAARRWWLARTDPPAARQLRQLELYERMLRLLDRAGLAKPASVPPLAYARALAPARPEVARGIERLASLYYAVRFGQAPLTHAVLDDAERTLSDLRSALAAPAHPTQGTAP